MSDRASTPPRREQVAALVIAWLIVGIPALWGVLEVARKSLALFR